MHDNLEKRYGQPPFTVLDAKKKTWQVRKKNWISLGISSDKGRLDDLTYNVHNDDVVSQKLKAVGGTSIFDPVLCELLYTWYSNPNDKVLDPFSGGSVRGIIGSKLNRNYVGIDIRPEQIVENDEQAQKVCTSHIPEYIEGDSNVVLDTVCDESFEFGLSCPPYADLEVYSDIEGDVSNLPYDEFLPVYESIIAKSYEKMKNDTFFAWVVGEVRDKKGNYYNFVGDTINAFQKAGFNYYNEIVLLTPLATVPLRTSTQFPASRKNGKCHQNVLVFVKGSGKKATQRLDNDIKFFDFSQNLGTEDDLF